MGNSMARQVRNMAASAVVLVAASLLAPAAQAAVVISSEPSKNMMCSSGVCSPTKADAVLNVDDLETQLASGSVTVTTTGSGVQANDINIVAPLSWSSSNVFELDAYDSVVIDNSLSVAGPGTLALVTNDGGTNGVLSFDKKGRASFENLSSQLTINGKTYFLIGSVVELAQAIRKNPSHSFALANNYNAQPDGTYSYSPVATRFTGKFEGLGNTISNLTIVVNGHRKYVGLFALVSGSGLVENLNLRNANVSATGKDDIVGAIAAENEGTVYADSVAGSVTVGNSATNFSAYGGGLVGFNAGAITGSHAAVRISGGKEATVGGLVGMSVGSGAYHGKIVNSYATGHVRVGAEGLAGGLVGNVYGGTISGSFASNSVSGGSSPLSYGEFGGLIGLGEAAAVANCYATGNVTGHAGEGTGVGGFIGQDWLDLTGGSLTASYSTGIVTAPGGDADYEGGFAGVLSEDTTTTGDYWDTTTSGTEDGASGANFPGVTGLTTAQLQSGLPAGFDPTIWAESPTINNGFPYLIANPPPK